jgi:hypothetical protein
MKYLILLCLFMVGPAAAGSITFDVCSGYTVSKKGNDVLVRCPGDPIDTPWLTFVNCLNPIADRSIPGKLVITCRGKIVYAPPVPAPQ